VIRYYLIATLIVIAIGGIVYAHRLAAPNLRISAKPAGTPTVETHVRAAAATAPPFTGQGPWVLSALPACFDEQSRTIGPYAELAANVPPAEDRIPAGTTLQVADCAVTVRPRDLWVERGPDRLRVPPVAALYRVAGRLVLTVRTGKQLEIRHY
jgi:hypothetical protein